MYRNAYISADGIYRYHLHRVWDATKPLCAFIMLNPSKADAETDDPTVRKCMGFAQRLDFGGIVVFNLFAYRATKPAKLRIAGYPVGVGNDVTMDRVLQLEGIKTVICAWGRLENVLAVKHRAIQVVEAVRRLGIEPQVLAWSAGDNNHKVPRHPLMLPYADGRELKPLGQDWPWKEKLA